MARPSELNEEEYLEIEEALAANARGRAFLRMRDRRSQVIGIEEARRLMRSLRDQITRQPAAAAVADTSYVRILQQELREMSTCIEQTRSEIAALRPPETNAIRVTSATGELDAIVSTTERATSEILNAAERICSLAGKLPDDEPIGTIRGEIVDQATEILTACSFQDITGQRMTKVVNTLRYLETRVNSMIGIWGSKLAEEGRGTTDTRRDAHLLNGPSDSGVSQADVDALLAGLAKMPDTPPSATSKPAAAIQVAPPAPPKPAPAAVAKPEMANGHAAEPPAATINQNDIDALFD